MYYFYNSIHFVLSHRPSNFNPFSTDASRPFRVFWSLQAVVTEFLLLGTLMKSGLKEAEGS